MNWQIRIMFLEDVPQALLTFYVEAFRPGGVTFLGILSMVVALIRSIVAIYRLKQQGVSVVDALSP
jgi:hypothetical protein